MDDFRKKIFDELEFLEEKAKTAEKHNACERLRDQVVALSEEKQNKLWDFFEKLMNHKMRRDEPSALARMVLVVKGLLTVQEAEEKEREERRRQRNGIKLRRLLKDLGLDPG